MTPFRVTWSLQLATVFPASFCLVPGRISLVLGSRLATLGLWTFKPCDNLRDFYDSRDLQLSHPDKIAQGPPAGLEHPMQPPTSPSGYSTNVL